MQHYAQNVITDKPAVRTTIPLAVNDPAGMWTIQATDVASGRASKATFTVTAAASEAVRGQAHFSARNGPKKEPVPGL